MGKTVAELDPQLEALLERFLVESPEPRFYSDGAGADAELSGVRVKDWREDWRVDRR